MPGLAGGHWLFGRALCNHADDQMLNICLAVALTLRHVCELTGQRTNHPCCKYFTKTELEHQLATEPNGVGN